MTATATATVPDPRTAAALVAGRRDTDAVLGRVRESITRLRREKAQVSVVTVVRRANVSRTARPVADARSVTPGL